MRVCNVKGTIHIPLMSGTLIDDNNCYYDEEVLKKACSQAEKLPLILKMDFGASVTGIIEKIEYNFTELIVHIIFRAVGTEEEHSAVIIDDKVIKIQDTRFTAFGISVN